MYACFLRNSESRIEKIQTFDRIRRKIQRQREEIKHRSKSCRARSRQSLGTVPPASSDSSSDFADEADNVPDKGVATDSNHPLAVHFDPDAFKSAPEPSLAADTDGSLNVDTTDDDSRPSGSEGFVNKLVSLSHLKLQVAIQELQPSVIASSNALQPPPIDADENSACLAEAERVPVQNSSSAGLQTHTANSLDALERTSSALAAQNDKPLEQAAQSSAEEAHHLSSLSSVDLAQLSSQLNSLPVYSNLMQRLRSMRLLPFTEQNSSLDRFAAQPISQLLLRFADADGHITQRHLWSTVCKLELSCKVSDLAHLFDLLCRVDGSEAHMHYTSLAKSALYFSPQGRWIVESLKHASLPLSASIAWDSSNFKLLVEEIVSSAGSRLDVYK